MSKMDFGGARLRELSHLGARQAREQSSAIDGALGHRRVCRATTKQISCECGHVAVKSIPTRPRVRLRCSACGKRLEIDGTIPG